jgi:hypothetical protein
MPATRVTQHFHDDAPVIEDPQGVTNYHPLSLRGHQNLVANLAMKNMQERGLPADVMELVRIAALHHDAGKAHPHWVATSMQFLGAELASTIPLLAKIVIPEGIIHGNGDDRVLPRHVLLPHRRHEYDSVQIAGPLPDEVTALVATHHGWGRGHYPWELGRGDPPIDLDRSVRQRIALAVAFSQQKPWRYAYLSAILAIADMRASQVVTSLPVAGDV